MRESLILLIFISTVLSAAPWHPTKVKFPLGHRDYFWRYQYKTDRGVKSIVETIYEPQKFKKRMNFSKFCRDSGGMTLAQFNKTRKSKLQAAGQSVRFCFFVKERAKKDFDLVVWSTFRPKLWSTFSATKLQGKGISLAAQTILNISAQGGSH